VGNSKILSKIDVYIRRSLKKPEKQVMQRKVVLV